MAPVLYTVLLCVGSSPIYSPIVCWLQSYIQSYCVLNPFPNTVLLFVESSPIYSPIVSLLQSYIQSCHMLAPVQMGLCSKPIHSHVICWLQSNIQPYCVLNPVLYTFFLCVGSNPTRSPIVSWH